MNTMARVVVVGTLLLSSGAGAGDVAEPPPIKTYAGSIAGEGSFRKFDEFILPTAKRPDSGPRPGDLKLAGKVWRIPLSGPDGRSALEVFQNYREALTRSGYTILFTCQSEECGSGDGIKDEDLQRFGYALAETRYLAARLSRPEGDRYVGLTVTRSLETSLAIIETQPMETGKVTVDASAIASGLEREGHMAIYGILFDSDKAVLKPESKAALEAVAATLRKAATLKLYVIGHTDSAGPLDRNLDLSRRRATAVVNELVAVYKIAPERLKADGAGPYAPVASNRSEPGRAKNRRVELVEQ